MKYPVVTLCGSTRFKDEYEKAQKELTLKGNIVISVGLFGHSGDNEVWEGMTEDTLTETKRMLDDMHKSKIDMADRIFVVNPGGYIGKSTWSEICYARMLDMPIESLEFIPSDEIDAKVAERIESAELLAWQSLDTVIHQGEYADLRYHPCIKQGKDKVYDPWYEFDEEYTGEPLSGHRNAIKKSNPFEKYGKKKMARFVEEIIAARGNGEA